jgi:hypothetical protein
MTELSNEEESFRKIWAEMFIQIRTREFEFSYEPFSLLRGEKLVGAP